MVELPDDVGHAARTAYDRLWNDGAQESACLVAALLAAYPLIAARVRAEALIQLCEALGEPIETPADHPSEPPYRTTWDRALDIARGRTAVWFDLLRRAAVADAEWLAEYRGRAGAAVLDPVAEAVAAERQRIVSEFATVARVAHVADGETDAERLLEAARRIGSGYPVRGANTAEAVARLLRFVARFISAAGSVPVATPEDAQRTHESDVRGTAHGSGVYAELEASRAPDLARQSPRQSRIDGSSGPVATPAGHVHGFALSGRCVCGAVATPTESERQQCPDKHCERYAGHPGLHAVRCRKQEGCVDPAGHRKHCTTGAYRNWGWVATPTEPGCALHPGLLCELHDGYCAEPRCEGPCDCGRPQRLGEHDAASPVPAERCPCKACAGPDGGETRCKCDLCIRSAIWRPESTCICQLCEYARGLVKVRHRTV